MAKKPTKKQSGIGGPILVIVVLYALLHSGIASGGGSYNCRHLEHLWVRAGGSISSEIQAADVGMAESSGNSRAYNSTPCAPNSNAEGIWQICMPLNSKYVPGGNAYDPLANAQAAVIMSGDGKNWNPWPDSYTSGQSPGQC
jgi:hypothetical protein